MANSNLNKAKKAKNDEFYTRIEDIEKEVIHYRKHFRGKKVFLNCDDPEWSNFWRFFELNFEFLGLKKLTAVHFEADKPSYKLELEHDINGDGKINSKDIIKTNLEQNGDFRSPESIAILKESDIVVTNPPFSLFREYIKLIVNSGKKFLIIGNKSSMNYKEVTPMVLEGKVWAGVNLVNAFIMPDGSIGSAPAAWFTNLEHDKRNEELPLYKKYNEKDYPLYDNKLCINVDKVKDIPVDYEGVIAVPVTYLYKHNPSQFEIVGHNDGSAKGFTINGTKKYSRFHIKWKR